MNKMTKQEAFDKVYKHFVIHASSPSVVRKKLRKGGYKRVCMYRSPNGNKCSAGLFFHNGGEYKPSYEGQPFFRVCPTRLKHLVYFIVELQYVHDAVAMFSDEHITSSFRKKLIDVADRHNLTIPR